jgi:hypothetical protein
MASEEPREAAIQKLGVYSVGNEPVLTGAAAARQTQIDEIRDDVVTALNKANIPGHAFGHAYVWGYITITLKNGSPKVYKALFTSVCTGDAEATLAVANSVPGVSGCWLNWD